MVFATSTQAKHWIFTPEALEKSRQAVHQATVAKLKPDVEPISLQDQSLLRRHYEFMFAQVCKLASLPEKCQATATMYFKRFYLAYSVMEYDPKVILLTCTYLASKTEENRVAIDDMCKRIKVAPEKLLQHEMILLQGIKFELQVYHAFRPLQGFIMDISESGFDASELWGLAHNEVTLSMTTDLPLLYAPSLIALGALLKVALSNPNNEKTVQDYIQNVTARQASSPEELQVLMANVTAVADFLKEMPRQPPATEVVRGIDKKLRLCVISETADADAQKAKDKEAKKLKKLEKLAEQEKADMELLTGKRT